MRLPFAVPGGATIALGEGALEAIECRLGDDAGVVEAEGLEDEGAAAVIAVPGEDAGELEGAAGVFGSGEGEGDGRAVGEGELAAFGFGGGEATGGGEEVGDGLVGVEEGLADRFPGEDELELPEGRLDEEDAGIKGGGGGALAEFPVDGIEAVGEAELPFGVEAGDAGGFLSREEGVEGLLEEGFDVVENFGEGSGADEVGDGADLGDEGAPAFFDAADGASVDFPVDDEGGGDGVGGERGGVAVENGEGAVVGGAVLPAGFEGVEVGIGGVRDVTDFDVDEGAAGVGEEADLVDTGGGGVAEGATDEFEAVFVGVADVAANDVVGEVNLVRIVGRGVVRRVAGSGSVWASASSALSSVLSSDGASA